jgi:hypothetical protein
VLRYKLPNIDSGVGWTTGLGLVTNFMWRRPGREFRYRDTSRIMSNLKNYNEESTILSTVKYSNQVLTRCISNVERSSDDLPASHSCGYSGSAYFASSSIHVRQTTPALVWRSACPHLDWRRSWQGERSMTTITL